MRPRLLPVAFVLAGLLAVTGLAGCDAKAGAAAFIGSERISQDSLNGYVTTNAVQSAGAQQVSLKPTVLSNLIAGKLFERYLEAHGGVPSDGALNALRDEALQNVAGGATGDAAATALRTQVVSLGFDDSFADLYTRTHELAAQIETDLKDTDGTALVKAIDGLGVPITVNPRYGSWDPTQLGISDPATPPYLTLVSATPTTTPSAEPTQ